MVLAGNNANGHPVYHYDWVSWLVGVEYSEIELGDIKTGRSFTPRGDKDCHHRNVSGVVTVGTGPGTYRKKFWDELLDFEIGPGTGKLDWRLNWESNARNVGQHTVYANCYYDTKTHGEKVAFYDHLVVVDDKGMHPHCPKTKISRLEWTALGPSVPQIDVLEGAVQAYKEWKTRFNFSSDSCHVDVEYTKCWQDAMYSVVVPGPAGVPFISNHFTGMMGTEVEKYFYDVSLKRDGSGHVIGLVFAFSNGSTVVIDDRSRDTFWAANENQDYGSTLRCFEDRALPRIRKMVSDRLADLEEQVPRDYIPMDLKTDLISDAVDDAKVLAINSVAFLRDLYHIKELILPILQLKKKPMNVKSWANLWLTYDYGIRLLIQDIHTVVTNLPQSDVKFALTHVRAAKHRTVQGKQQSYDVEYHAKLLIDPKIGEMNSILDKLRRLDLVLSRENLWDFVPYSFVVDWFFPIGEKLAQLDLQSDLALLGAKTAILSSKASTSFTLNKRLPADGGAYNWARCSVDVKVYWRWHDIPSISVLDVEFSNGLNLHRGANGMALVIQKIKP
jgi:hypothetical protein